MATKKNKQDINKELPIFHKIYFNTDSVTDRRFREIADEFIYPVLTIKEESYRKYEVLIYSHSEFVRLMDYAIKNDLFGNLIIPSRSYGNWDNTIAHISLIHIYPTASKFIFELYNGSVKLEYVND